MAGELKHVEEIERSGESYEFDLLRVVQSPDGRLFYGTDSGCSCPEPFDGFCAEADWTPIRRGESWTAFQAAVRNWANGGDAITAQEIDAFIDRIKAILYRRASEDAR